jgi:hypothetical protein
LTLGLLAFVLLLLVMSGHLFEDAKNDVIKDGSKLQLKILSVIMLLYITILQAPTTTVLFKGFLCNEDPN